MHERIHEQLDKILALADSSHDAEALAAVRKARQMLSRDGLSFSDLARGALSPHSSVNKSNMFSFLSGHNAQLESQIQHLRHRLEDLEAQMQTQDLQLDFWRRRATDLEQSSVQALNEAERWKKLARDTAERLWDMGQNFTEEETLLPPTTTSHREIVMPATIKK